MPEARKYLQKVATYTPLSRKRFRWNQGAGKGAILKRSVMKNHRRPLINAHLRRLGSLESSHSAESPISRTAPPSPIAVPRSPEPKKKMLRAIIDQAGDVQCPYCGSWHFRDCNKVKPGQMTCRDCRQDFIAEKEEYKRARVDEDGDVRCPYCGRYKHLSSLGLGLTQCRHCDELFFAFK